MARYRPSSSSTRTSLRCTSTAISPWHLPTEIGRLTQLTTYTRPQSLSGTVPTEVGRPRGSEAGLYNNLSAARSTEMGLLTRLTSLRLHGNPERHGPYRHWPPRSSLLGLGGLNCGGSPPSEAGRLKQLLLCHHPPSSSGRLPPPSPRSPPSPPLRHAVPPRRAVAGRRSVRRHDRLHRLRRPVPSLPRAAPPPRRQPPAAADAAVPPRSPPLPPLPPPPPPPPSFPPPPPPGCIPGACGPGQKCKPKPAGVDSGAEHSCFCDVPLNIWSVGRPADCAAGCASDDACGGALYGTSRGALVTATTSVNASAAASECVCACVDDWGGPDCSATLQPTYLRRAIKRSASRLASLLLTPLLLWVAKSLLPEGAKLRRVALPPYLHDSPSQSTSSTACSTGRPLSAPGTRETLTLRTMQFDPAECVIWHRRPLLAPLRCGGLPPVLYGRTGTSSSSMSFQDVTQIVIYSM